MIVKAPVDSKGASQTGSLGSLLFAQLWWLDQAEQPPGDPLPGIWSVARERRSGFVEFMWRAA